MRVPAFDLLLVAWPAGFAAPDAFDSVYGRYRVARSEREAIAATLEHTHADAVLIGASATELEALAGWPGLADVVAQCAVVLAVAEPPPAERVAELVAAGVQDVLVGADAPAISRALRLAIERHAREQAARKASSTDLLTGLPNQAQLVEHTSQLLALREREPNPMVLIALRLEGLAAIEAEFGREATNALRRKLAVRLRAAIRAGDVIASTAVDRFVVLLPHVQSADDGEHVAGKLLTALRAPIALSGRQAGVAAAAGVAQYPRDGKDAAVLLRLATDLAAQAPALGRSPDRIPRAEAANDD